MTGGTNMDNSDKEYVNGPINSFRLEGTIDGHKKVIWLFGDFHINPSSQIECDVLKATDLRTYLLNNFDAVKNNGQTYDFIFETWHLSTMYNKPDKLKGKYIDQVDKMFRFLFTRDPETDKVISSPIYPNVRFHYIDFRSYYYYDIDNVLARISYVIYDVSPSRYGAEDLLNIKDTLLVAISMMKHVDNMLYGSKSGKMRKYSSIPKSVATLGEYKDEDIRNIFSQFVNKIRSNDSGNSNNSSYKHKEVGNNLNTVMGKELNDMFEKFFKMGSQLMEILTEYVGKVSAPTDKLVATPSGEYRYYTYKVTDDLYDFHYKFRSLFTKFHEMYIYIGALIMDLYCLRRILDKDYVTNAIVYTGMLHTSNYVNMLIKHFGFKITHASYSKYDADEVTKRIKQTSSFNGASEYLYPPEFNQCSDLSSFPKHFA